MSYLRQFTETNITQAIVVVLQLVTNIIIARTLGPTLKGEYSSILAIYEIVIYLTLFGISSSIIYTAPRSEELAKKVAFKTVLFTIFNSSIASLILTFLALVENPFVKNITTVYLLYCVPIALASIGISYFASLLLSRQLIREMNFLNILSSFFPFTGVVFLSATHLVNIQNLIFINIANFYLVFFIYFYIVIKYIGIKFQFDFNLIKQMLSISFKSYLIGLIGYIIVRSDIVLLNMIKGNYHVGIYTVAAGLSFRLLLIPQTASSLLQPRAVKEREKTLAFQLKVSRLISFLMFSALTLSSLLIYPAILILYGHAYANSVYPYLLLIPGIYFFSIVSQIAPYYLSLGYPPITLIAPFISAVTNIVLNLILIPYLGYNAAAITSSISYFLLFLIYYLDFRRRKGVKLEELMIPKRADLSELYERIKETAFAKRLQRK